ncbi:MAG: hypothetical protein ABIM85_02220 [candidate division WOR-3 bacterium]
MILNLIFSFAFSLEVFPPIVFDLTKEEFPPPYFPYFYETVYKNHFIRIEYDKEGKSDIRYISLFIKGKVNSGEIVKINNFLYSIEKQKGEKDFPFLKNLSENYNFLTEIELKEEKGEIIIPFYIVYKAEENISSFDPLSIQINLTFKIHVK